MIYKLATSFSFLYKIKMQDFLFQGHYFKNEIIKQQLKYKDLLNVRLHKVTHYCMSSPLMEKLHDLPMCTQLEVKLFCQ